MDRRSFVKAATLIPLSMATAEVSFASLASPAGETISNISGIADERFKLTLRRVLDGDSPRFTEDFLLADVKPTKERRFTEFSGDTSGRYIGALATAGRVYGVDTPGQVTLVEKVIALQKPGGYFGAGFNFEHPTDAEMALLWGNGRLLVGLMEYYAWKPSGSVLESAKRIGDFLVRVSELMLSKEIRNAFGAQHFASSYICWTQQTEGLAALYKVTKDERYRKLAEQIAAVIQRLPGDHVHGYLTSLRGVMDLYALTREPKLLEQCESAWRDISASSDLLITGGVPEGWSPNKHRTEGCAEADWVRLNLALWRVAGDAKYLNMAERAIFNEFAMNQFATGDFGHRVYTGTGFEAAGAARAWWCCTLHGLRCFPDIAESAFRAVNDGLRYEMPVSGSIESEVLTASAESTLAQDGTVRIRILKASGNRARIAIRKHAWAAETSMNFKAPGSMEPIDPGYIGAEKVWKAGDTIEVRYKMRSRSERCGAERKAFWYGPWLLGASAQQNPAYFNELTPENRLIGEAKPLADAGGGGAGVFSVPVAACELKYKHAEYPDQPGTVTLRPVAEQTGLPTTSWELRFLTSQGV
ncbi:MAG TPA: beta-L-arabinofuranosidase domain-containing protein [Terracidiphilus sp.]|jgi:DUF1680 family protein